MRREPGIVDRSALRVNQAGILAFALLGFVTDQPSLPAFVAVVLLAGSVHPALALFKQIYFRILKPLGIVKPDPARESPAPHAFAQLLGGAFLLAGTLLLLAGSPALGWGFTWVVILLAAVNLFFGFCAGCFLYFQLGRHGVPGFRHRPGEEGN